MTRLDLAREELQKHGVFNEHKNLWMMQMVNALGTTEVPFHMACAIANYVMASYSNHFHTKIELSPTNRVPANYIAFILAKSGARKTSSVSKLEKAIARGIDAINMQRQMRLEQKLGDDAKKKPLNPLYNALATEAGMIKRLNEFKREGLGCPAMFVDEVATELETNNDMIPNIKLIAQLFDEGNMKSKPLKDSENQSEEVTGMGMCALFIGSEHAILEDEALLHKFNVEFVSKLSRRTFFVYPSFSHDDQDLDSIDKILESIEQERAESEKFTEMINHQSVLIANARMNQDTYYLKVPPEVMRLYNVYKIYCEEMAEFETVEQAILEQQHRHWKAFKLAGVYAVWNLREEITTQDLLDAIWFAEFGKNELKKFIDKSQRSMHEKLADHYRDGGATLSMHDIIKRKWAKNVREIDDLVRIANSSLDNDGVLKLLGEKILYEKFERTEGVGCSFKKVTGTKQERARQCADGFKFKRAPFEKLANIMSNDTAYCAFEFKDGIRGKDNVLNGADYVILDIDDDGMTDLEAHDMLADFNHIICRTSNGENPYKYRIAIPTDIYVDVENSKWPLFMKAVSEYLGITIDILPKSQIYFGYANREPIVYLEGEELPASEIIKGLGSPPEKPKPIPNHLLADAYNQRMFMFQWFYEAGDPSDNTAKGHYHNTLFLFTRNAAERGLDRVTAEAILLDIIDFRTRKPRDGWLDWIGRYMDNYEEWKGQPSIIKGEISPEDAKKWLEDFYSAKKNGVEDDFEYEAE